MATTATSWTSSSASSGGCAIGFSSTGTRSDGVLLDDGCSNEAGDWSHGDGAGSWICDLRGTESAAGAGDSEAAIGAGVAAAGAGAGA